MIFSAPVTVAWSGVECNFLSSKWEGSHVKPEWHYIRSKHISNWKENIWCLYQHISQTGWFGSYVSLSFEKFIWWNIWQCQWWYSKLSRRNLIWFVDFLVFCVLFWILLFCWKELGGNLRGRERSGLIWIDLHLPAAVARHSAYWAVVGDVVVDVVEVGGVLALLLLLHPLCILRRNKGGGVTRLDREGGVSVWGEIETAKSSKTDSPWSGPPWR